MKGMFSLWSNEMLIGRLIGAQCRGKALRKETADEIIRELQSRGVVVRQDLIDAERA